MEQTYDKGQWSLLEPIMLVEVVCPVEYQNIVTNQISKRFGIIQNIIQGNELYTCTAEVPLNDMFGYSTELRIATQGQGEYSQEYVRYAPAREDVKHKLVNEYKQRLEKAENKN